MSACLALAGETVSAQNPPCQPPDESLLPQGGLPDDQKIALYNQQVRRFAACTKQAPVDAEIERLRMEAGVVIRKISDTANAQIADIQAKEDGIKAANPDWASHTAAVTFYYEGQPGAYYSNDPRPMLLGTLGINTTDIDKLGDPSTGFYISISPENLDKLDSDANVWLGATEPGTQDAIEALPLFAQMNATQQGGQIWSTDGVFEGAFSFASPLSIPYALDALVPRLTAAFDGDPSTLPEPIVAAS